MEDEGFSRGRRKDIVNPSGRIARAGETRQRLNNSRVNIFPRAIVRDGAIGLIG
jgi:hypothetical protein